MFNSTNFLKASGAVLGAFLFFLIGAWAASSMFSVGGGAHAAAEGDAAHDVAMMTATPDGLLDDGSDTEDEAEPIEVAAVELGSGDAAAGEKVFGKCKACHKVNGSNGVGPHLDGVVDRPLASVDGFNYSDAFKTHGGAWDLATLDAYLTNPKEYIPGNKMAFAGLKKPEDRNDVIAYLQSLSQ